MTPEAQKYQEQQRKRKAAEISHTKWSELPAEIICTIHDLLAEYKANDRKPTH